MNACPSPVWNDLSDGSCGTMLSFCTAISDSVPESPDGSPGSFRWYEQDSADDLADEILAWASAEEATLPRPDAGLADDFSPVRGLPA